MKFVKVLFVTTLFFNLNVAIAASTAFPPESMLTPGAKLVVGEGPGNDFNVVDERDEARTRAGTSIPHTNIKRPVSPDVTPEMPAAQAPTLLPQKPILPTTKAPTGISAKSPKKATHVASAKKATHVAIAKKATHVASAKKATHVAAVKPKAKKLRLVNRKKITKYRFAENHKRTIHASHPNYRS